MQPDQTPPSPPPTFATAPGIEPVNSTFVSYDCGEEETQHHLDCKGDFLDALSWEDDIDG